jgi:LPXTG-site transpeptidase (sortase) family protein
MSRTESQSKKSSAGVLPVSHADLIGLYRKALLAGVALETLDEKIGQLWERAKVTHDREAQDDKTWQQRWWGKLPKVMRVGAALVPVGMIAAGVGLLGSALWPIATYYVQTLPTLQASQLLSPIPPEKVLDVTPLLVAQAKTLGEEDDQAAPATNDLGPIVIDTKLDYTNLSNWFADGTLPVVKRPEESDSEVMEYRLDIPKVEIVNATVKVGGDDLNHSLIQYQGTASPGKSGSPVIFGHSVLRQFYNPKETNSRRYTSIFSKIMTLQKGDKIYLTVGNSQYRYIVEDKTEVKPTDTFILSQRYDVKQLKLVTCVPEGTYLRRGVVTARLLTN